MLRIHPIQWSAAFLLVAGALFLALGMALLVVWNGALVSLEFGRGPWLLGPAGFVALLLGLFCLVVGVVVYRANCGSGQRDRAG